MAEAKVKRKRARRARPRAAGWLRKRRHAIVWGLAGSLLTVAMLAIALYAGYGRMHGPSGGALTIEWPADLGPEEAAALLHEKGIVRGADAFAVFLRATGGTADFVPGTHLLWPGASPWELRRMLSRSSARPQVKVVIPEGYNRFDVAARLERLHVASRDAFLAATADARLLDDVGIAHHGEVVVESAEGYLFPATYELGVDTDPRDVLRRLVAEADKRWRELAAENEGGVAGLAAPPLGWGRREILTLAAVVEKEAVVDDERPIIAGVFMNRLLDPEFKPHRLQSDPTAMYGCLTAPDEAPSCASFTGKASPAINTDPKNRFSTYTHDGLPPGPICNPGAASIRAVLAPAATKYFYFVAAGGGRHTFSEDLAHHNDAIKKARASSTPP